MYRREAGKPYRVVQWATGHLGQEALRQIIDHPDLELVGVYVYSDSKAGRDAGSFCQRPSTGITATNRIEDILALQADFVLHMPMLEPTPETSDREVIALLESGKNVISLRGYFWPRWLGAANEQKFIDACTRGNATLHGNGICPGFVFDRIGPAMTSFCATVSEVRCIEYFDLRMRPAHTIYDVIGLGHPPGKITVDHQTPRTLTTLYSEMYHLMAAQWETEVLSVDLDLEWIPAERDIQIAAGRIAKGTSAGTIWTWSIRMANGLLVTQKSHWHVDTIPGWDSRNVWIVDVIGEPRIRAEMPLEEIGPDALTKGGYDPNGRALAALCINAMPEVYAAPPGILKPTIFAPWRGRFKYADSVMSQPADTAPTANPRRPDILPWRIGLLIDWAFATEPVIDYADAITLALEQAHQTGRIDRPVDLVVRRVYGGPNASALDVLAAFRELAYEQRVLGIIGPTLPDDMMACRHEFDRAMIPVLSFGGTMGVSSSFLFQLPNGTYVDEIRMIVNYAKAQGFRSIALMRDMSMMGEEYTATFHQAMREAGLQVAGIRAIRPSPSPQELLEATLALKATGAGALLLITVAVHRHFVAALAAADWAPARLMVCNFVGSLPGFDGPSAFEGWIGVDQYDEANPTFSAMTAKFQARFGRHAAHTYQAIGYDIGRTLAHALSIMAPATPEGLRDALEKVRMLPAAAGAKGTHVSFAKSDRRGYKGNYLVYRTVKNGQNIALGALSDYLY